MDISSLILLLLPIKRYVKILRFRHVNFNDFEQNLYVTFLSKFVLNQRKINKFNYSLIKNLNEAIYYVLTSTSITFLLNTF